MTSPGPTGATHSPDTSANPSPTFHAAAEGTSNIVGLLGGILDDATTLIKQQLTMASQEIKEDLGRTATGAKYLGLGAFLTGLGLLFILMGVPPLLMYLTGWEAWVCWMLSGLVITIVGLIALGVGGRLMKKFNPIPQKSLNALSENVSWLTKPQK